MAKDNAPPPPPRPPPGAPDTSAAHTQITAAPQSSDGRHRQDELERYLRDVNEMEPDDTSEITRAVRRRGVVGWTATDDGIEIKVVSKAMNLYTKDHILRELSELGVENVTFTEFEPT